MTNLIKYKNTAHAEAVNRKYSETDYSPPLVSRTVF